MGDRQTITAHAILARWTRAPRESGHSSFLRAATSWATARCGVDLEPHRPVPVPGPPPNYEAELDGLVEQLRVSLTTPWTAQDQRTGEHRAASPAVHEDFTLVDLALDRAAPAVRVTFRWAAEPGLTFAYDHPLSIPPVTSSIEGHASIFIVEEICTGLVLQIEFGV